MSLKSLVAVALASFSATTSANDPFLWLEDVDSAQSLEWVNKHNDSTFARLQNREIFARLEGEMREITTSNARLPGISLSNGQLYTFWQDSKHPRGLWQRTSLENYKNNKNEWEVLLDLD